MEPLTCLVATPKSLLLLLLLALTPLLGPAQSLKLTLSFFGMEFYAVDALISQPAQPMSLCPSAPTPPSPPVAIIPPTPAAPAESPPKAKAPPAFLPCLCLRLLPAPMSTG